MFMQAIVLMAVLAGVFSGGGVFAQQSSVEELDARLRAVEEYLDTLPPSLATYTGSLEQGINNYTKNLEEGLAKYSEHLEESLESRLLGISNKTVELSPDNRSYQKIETPTGMFFINVQDMQPVNGGYRLFLQIGNPNYADFRDFTLRLVWGKKWTPGSPLTFDQWRESLTGAKYSFKGQLARGKWNPVEVDLIPATAEDIEYIECELGVSSIELETP